MIKVNDVVITPTIFPDGTIQVWKLPEEVLNTSKIYWKYENDSELIIVCQLAQLLTTPILVCPFLPYGRQDKDISNNSTFGLHTFIKLISNFFDSLQTIDGHSNVAYEICKNNNLKYYDLFPTKGIGTAIKESACDLICFPDNGAKLRYTKTPHWSQIYNNLYSIPNFHLNKIRNQETGEITGLSIDGDINLSEKSILIIDDICDGGRTFIEASKLLYSNGALNVNLYVTHGIFSKGVDIINQSGINRIFTNNYELELS